MRYEKHIDLARIGPVRAAFTEFRRRRRAAVEVSKRELLRASKPYVSVSGGKDSLALLGVVAEAARLAERPVTAWAHVSDASFPGTEEIIQQACAVAGVPLVIDRSPVSAFDVFGHAGDTKFGKEGYFFDAIRAWIAQGYDLCFTGVRAAESRRRMQAARAHGTAFDTTIPAPHRKCEPLAWWSIEDVAAAIHIYRMPIHPIYTKRPLTGGVPIRLGYVTAADWASDQAAFLRINYPEQFRRLAEVYPEVRNHV